MKHLKSKCNVSKVDNLYIVHGCICDAMISTFTVEGMHISGELLTYNTYNTRCGGKNL